MSTTQRGKSRALGALAILVLGLVAALIGLAGTSSAIEEVGDLPTPVTSDADDCVPSAGAKAYYSDWANDGGPVTTHDSNPPGADTATVRHLPGGTEKHVTQQSTDDSSERRWLVWTGGPVGDSGPSAGAPLGPGGWNTPQGDPNGVPHQGHADGVPYRTGEGNSPWFMWKTVVTPGQQEQSHTDYRWQAQTRTLTPAVSPTLCVAGSESTAPGDGDGDGDGNGNGNGNGNGVIKGDDGGAQVLGVEANAPAAAGAPAAAPTAVDAGFGAVDQGVNPMLWLLVGGAMTIAGAALGLAPGRERGKRSW